MVPPLVWGGKKNKKKKGVGFILVSRGHGWGSPGGSLKWQHQQNTDCHHPGKILKKKGCPRKRRSPSLRTALELAPGGLKSPLSPLFFKKERKEKKRGAPPPLFLGLGIFIRVPNSFAAAKTRFFQTPPFKNLSFFFSFLPC